TVDGRDRRGRGRRHRPADAPAARVRRRRSNPPAIGWHGPAHLWHRRPDPGRPGRSCDGIADPDAQQYCRTRRLWPQHHRRTRHSGRSLMAHVLIVEARFYSHLNDMLIDGVRSALEADGHSHETVTVPGALEIPAAISLAADTGRFDAYVALGVVIRGETYHFEVVSNESARGIMALTLDGLAIGNGILTVEDEDQALARADRTRKDKGG